MSKRIRLSNSNQHNSWNTFWVNILPDKDTVAKLFFDLILQCPLTVTVKLVLMIIEIAVIPLFMIVSRLVITDINFVSDAYIYGAESPHSEI